MRQPNSYHSTSLDPLAQTGSVDSGLNTDKSVPITQIFVFSDVWDSGWINSPLLSKMYGIQDVAPIPVISDN